MKLAGVLCCAIVSVALGLVVGATAPAAAAPPTAARWTLLRPRQKPEARLSAMVYEPVRQSVVLFGGWQGTIALPVFDDTWVWNGSKWTEQSPATTPPARFAHNITSHNAAPQHTVIFGGYGMSGSTAIRLDDTWVWDGTNWANPPANNLPEPAARSYSAMTYDAASARTVMFGGSTATGRLSDTWEWDGSDWAERLPATSPSPRYGHAMAYDEFRGVSVLFGGQTTTDGTQNDTWEWNGQDQDWVQRLPATSPEPRWVSAMTYDSNIRRVVLFGGRRADLSYIGDTWEWDGTDWTQTTPAKGPIARGYHTLTFEGTTGRTLLLGGCCTNQAIDDMWAYNPAR